MSGANDTLYRTDVRLANTSAFTVPVRLDFYQSSLTAGSGPTATADISLAPGEQEALNDIVGTLFSIDPGTGAIRLTVSRPIGVVARIYNDQTSLGNGTFGVSARGLEESERRTAGTLPGLSNAPPETDAGSRTNIGWFNPGSTEVTATFNAYDPSGALLETGTRVVPALNQLQVALTEIFPSLTSIADFYVTFTPTGGSLFVYAAVVDNVSGDVVFIPALRS